jgi:PAS domain S-box-containing protein
MTPESPREPLVRLGALLQSIASRRESEATPDVADAILWMSGPDGRCIFMSRGWTAYTGQSQAEALGLGWTSFVHPEDRERAGRVYASALAAREPYAVDYRLRRRDGAWRWVLDSGRPRREAGGEFAGHTGSVLDVHELSLAVEERDRLMRELEEADRRKDEFLATLSHELRNPLAPLRNSLQLLRLADRRDGAAAPIHERMERQVEHLVRLVDDLLEMSRVTRGAFELRRDSVELASVVRNAVETSAPLIDAAAHRLELALPPEPLVADGDPVRLTQILANLLNNAARYTARGGRISVTLAREGGAACIRVRDTGSGIAPELLPRLFAMFSRGGNSSGLGIGLALARRLAEMHGGSIEAKSEGPGRGSEFVVRLPLLAGAPAAQAPRPPAAKLRPRRILVVDDNRDAADSLAMLLSFLGAEVETANDGPGAIAAFERVRPAAVLLDLGMPGMDGYEVARSLRAAGADGVPIIALTGWGQDEDRRRAREAGFDHHLIKPADMGALQALLASLE